jgi:formylglycine-generating enzyme required for sulfatase activity
MSAFDAHADATNSQWFNACSSGGVNDYPYGSTYAGETCNGPELEGIATVEVGSMGGCQSLETEYAGVFDLSGNVWEWEDSCDADYGKFDSCRLRGGSFFPGDCIYCGSSFLRCDWDQYGFRDIAFADVDTIGFRCCSSP